MSMNTLGHRVSPSLRTALTATGSSRATAFLLNNNTRHEFTNVAPSTGAILPVGVTPSAVTVFNDGVSSLAIYPPLGGSIDAGTANASVSLAAGSGATFWASSSTNWYHLVSGSSGGTPGGTSGQIQYDNAGAFGGFTANGDATINTSTGAVTVSSTGGTAFGPLATLATVPSHGVLANTTSGSAAPAGVTLSSLFDAAIDNTQGDILFRGSNAWGQLGPGATAGGILITGGAAANPSWTTKVASGADGNLNFTGLSHSSPAAGDLWFPSSDQGTFAIGRASGPARLGGCIFSCGACTAVASTTAATSIFGTPTGALGSLTIPANTLVVGNVLRWTMWGIYSCTGSTPTIQFDYLLNGTTILSGALLVPTLAAAATNKPIWTAQINWMPILAVGSSAKAGGFAVLDISNSSIQFAEAIPGGATPAQSTTFASNSNSLFDIKVTWSANSATNSFQVLQFNLFLDN